MNDSTNSLPFASMAALVGDDDRPTTERLAKVLRDRPEVADEAVDLVTALVCDERLAGAEASAEDALAVRAAERALGTFRQALDRRLPPPPNPFAERSPRALRDVAREVGLDKTLVAKLRDRRIRASTVPEGVRRSLARALAITEEVLVRHLRAPAIFDPGMQFKARHAPRLAEKETFQTAVTRSGLSEDARRRLVDAEPERP